MYLPNLSEQQFKSFQQNGFIIVKNFCCGPEVATLSTAAKKGAVASSTMGEANGWQNSKTQLDKWFAPGDDVFGCLARSEKVVNMVRLLLGNSSPVCHVYSKTMEKQSKLGGSWAWHQDFAYWQANNFVNADKMLSVMVAITPISIENGCSQLIRGSHKLGNLPHDFEGAKVGANDGRVQLALESMEVVYPELEAGDALFFHSNLLHRSDANQTNNSTWSNISCYSLQENLSKRHVFSSWHTPVATLKNEEILNRAKPFVREYAIANSSWK